VRPHGSTNSPPSPSRNRFSLIESRAVPALIAAVLFFMSGGDVLIIGLAFALLVWALFSSRRLSKRIYRPPLVSAPGDPPDLLRAGIEWCQSMSGAKRVVLWSVDEGAGLVKPLAVTGGAWPNAHVLHGSPITWVARERVPSRLAPPPEWAETLRVIGISVVRADPTHALTLELVDDIEATPEQFEALGIYMGALLNVLDDHRNFEQRQARQDLFVEALRALPQARDGRAIGQDLVNLAMHMTGGSGASVVAWGGERGELVAAEGAGLQPGQILSEGHTLTVLAARSGATLNKLGPALRGMPIITEAEKLTQTPQAAAVIPLINQRNVIGVLTVWSATGRIDETAITLLETVAPFAAVLLQQARELSAMRALADRDALTGLANRRAFDSQLAGEWARWERYGRTFSLLMFDIDHFKAINDKLGHDGGDEVLEEVARALAKTLRNIDFAARYGGEEFAVLLPETGLKFAIDIAERLRARIEVLQVSYRGQIVPVTVSGGVATAEQHMTAADMLRTADQLLYRAKAEGRNRIVTELKRPGGSS
jgi:diguanylate cyclase (GGDEF)-like protein